MNRYEKFIKDLDFDTVLDLFYKHTRVFSKWIPCEDSTKTKSCLYTDKNCKECIREYLQEEVPDCSFQFTEFEKSVLLRAFPKIKYNYIARDSDGTLYLYRDKPMKGVCTWSCAGVAVPLPLDAFWCIKWSDNEPCEFRRYL